ncbi:MAG: hypothetical protein IKB16_14470 [Lentisphaeria bacterium]|nr:hypothetical protein [Lentisphaeria bacterium]
MNHTKICSLSLPLPGNEPLTIGAEGDRASTLLCQLGEMLCLPIHADMPQECRTVLADDPAIKGIRRNVENGTVVIRFNPAYISNYEKESYLMRVGVFGAYVLELHLTGRKDFALFHGTLLDEPDNQSILLFGESGVGKSTTRNRWLQEGGSSVADDAILLYHENGKFYARPLPTWSHWLEFGPVRRYPVMEKRELRRILWLTRGTVQEIVPAERMALYHCQLLSAMTLHCYATMRLFPAAERYRVGDQFWNMVQTLGAVYPAEEFRAHLDYPLHKTIYGEEKVQ